MPWTGLVAFEPGKNRKYFTIWKMLVELSALLHQLHQFLCHFPSGTEFPTCNFHQYVKSFFLEFDYPVRWEITRFLVLLFLFFFQLHWFVSNEKIIATIRHQLDVHTSPILLICTFELDEVFGHVFRPFSPKCTRSTKWKAPLLRRLHNSEQNQKQKKENYKYFFFFAFFFVLF